MPWLEENLEGDVVCLNGSRPPLSDLEAMTEQFFLENMDQLHKSLNHMNRKGGPEFFGFTFEHSDEDTETMLSESQAERLYKLVKNHETVEDITVEEDKKVMVVKNKKGHLMRVFLVCKYSEFWEPEEEEVVEEEVSAEDEEVDPSSVESAESEEEPDIEPPLEEEDVATAEVSDEVVVEEVQADEPTAKNTTIKAWRRRRLIIRARSRARSRSRSRARGKVEAAAAHAGEGVEEEQAAAKSEDVVALVEASFESEEIIEMSSNSNEEEAVETVESGDVESKEQKELAYYPEVWRSLGLKKPLAYYPQVWQSLGFNVYAYYPQVWHSLGFKIKRIRDNDAAATVASPSVGPVMRVRPSTGNVYRLWLTPQMKKK